MQFNLVLGSILALMFFFPLHCFCMEFCFTITLGLLYKLSSPFMGKHVFLLFASTGFPLLCLCYLCFIFVLSEQNSANESKETAAPTTTNVPDAVNSENVVDNDYDFADLDMECGAGSEMSGTLDELVGESTSMDVVENCGTDVSSGRSVNSSEQEKPVH